MVESNIGGQYSAIVSQYPGNAFEEQPSNYYPKTNFMAALVNVHMLSEELKKNYIKKLNLHLIIKH